MSDPDADKFMGDCFRQSMQLLSQSGIHRKFWLAHAMVCPKDGPVAGWKFAHAFLLSKDRQVVLDAAKGFGMRREQYFDLGGVDEFTLRTYTVLEARDHLLRTQHFGPWDEGIDWREIDPDGGVHDMVEAVDGVIIDKQTNQ